MYCSQCGFQNVNGEKYCKNCGRLLENNQAQQTMNSQFKQGESNNQTIQQPVINNMNSQTQQPMSNQQFKSSDGLNQNFINKVVNPNMNIWAILSVVIPIVALIWYWFIGLSFYLAIIIAGVGFAFAKKGKFANPKLAIVGNILNGILCAIAIIIYILMLIASM